MSCCLGILIVICDVDSNERYALAGTIPDASDELLCDRQMRKVGDRSGCCRFASFLMQSSGKMRVYGHHLWHSGLSQLVFVCLLGRRIDRGVFHVSSH